MSGRTKNQHCRRMNGKGVSRVGERDAVRRKLCDCSSVRCAYPVLQTSDAYFNFDFHTVCVGEHERLGEPGEPDFHATIYYSTGARTTDDRTI